LSKIIYFQGETMDKDTRYIYTARLSLRQPVYDAKGHASNYKHDICEIDFTSRLPSPEFVGIDIIHARPVDGVQVPEILRRSIDTLGLSTRSRTVLAASAIETVEDLVSMQPYELFKCKGAGETVLKECACALASIGLSLGISGRSTAPDID
jgi:DNA-directed RNA polymerase alpha subunit